tara:strand:+ start:471 stop:722 length:252 start_codon:yes stop_codon:yes gene_type:complete
MRINGRELDTGDTDRDDGPVDDNISEYIRFFKVCARERESLQNELKAVCNDKSLAKFLNQVEGMKGMYEHLRVLEDKIYKEDV